MKIAWTRMKGVCLLLLGLATAGGGRSFAADINTQNFAVLAEAPRQRPRARQPRVRSRTNRPARRRRPSRSNRRFRSTRHRAPRDVRLRAAQDLPVTTTTSAGPRADSGSAASISTGGPAVRTCLRWSRLSRVPTAPRLRPYSAIVTIRDGRPRRLPHQLRHVARLPTSLGCRGRLLRRHRQAGQLRQRFYRWLRANGSAFPIVRMVFDPAVGRNLQPDYVGYPDYYVGRITVQTSDYFQSAGIWLRRQLRASEWSTNNGDVNWTDPAPERSAWTPSAVIALHG